jgi:hypothetical protein
MRGMTKYSGIALLSLTLMAGLTACGGSSKTAPDENIFISEQGKVLFESSLQYVEVVPRDVTGSNQHPANYSVEEIRDVLASMYVNQRVLLRQEQIPLFSPGELQTLSSTLSRGLSVATPNEDINFVLLGVHQGMLARERKTNSGRVFIDQSGRLNIIFGLIHEDYRETDQYTGQRIDRRVNPLRPGSRRNDSSPSTRVALDNGQSYYQDPNTGRERSDWLVIDIPTVLAAAAERRGSAQSGMVSPELLEDVARNKRDNQILRDDMANIKEILFELTDEIEQLREQLRENASP